MKTFLFLALPAIGILYGCASDHTNSQKLTYPETEKTDHVDTYHGVDVPDPYRWLEDDTSAATTAWVTAQNEVTFGFLDQIDWRSKLKERIESLVDYERISAPYKHGDFEYYYRNSGLQNHSVLFRKPVDNKDAEPEVYLDPNTFSKDGTTGLSGVSFTEDGTLSAHLVTEGGSDWRKAIVMNALTKEVIEDTLINVKFSGTSWFKNEGFYYSSYDNPKDGSQLSGKRNTTNSITTSWAHPNQKMYWCLVEKSNLIDISAGMLPKTITTSSFRPQKTQVEINCMSNHWLHQTAP